MISIISVNEQVQRYMPDYRVIEYNKLLPRIEIYHQLPSLEEKFVFLVLKKDLDYVYAKIDLDGNLCELYPNINDEWIIDTILGHKIQLNKISCCEGTIPYVSFNIATETFNDLYYVTEIKEDYNKIYRIDIKTKTLNKIYYKIERLNNYFNLSQNEIDFIKKNQPETFFLYYNPNEKIPLAINMNYSAFHKNFNMLNHRLFL